MGGKDPPQGYSSRHFPLVWVLGFVCVGKAVHASNYAKGDQLHFPFDRVVEFIINQGCRESDRSTLKDRLRQLRRKVGVELFQRYKVNLDAYAMVLRCDGGHDRVFERTRALPLFMALTRAWRSPRPRARASESSPEECSIQRITAALQATLGQGLACPHR